MPQPAGGYGHHDDPPWANQDPQPMPGWNPVPGANPQPQPWHGDDDHGHPVPPPPPIVPDTNWHDQWLDQCDHDGHGHGGCQPPPNPGVYFDHDHDNRPIFITQVNVVNVYLTNPITGDVRVYPDIHSGTPWVPDDLPPGDWQWSAGYGDAYYGGGAFSIAPNGWYSPCERPAYPIVLYYDGYVPQIVPAGGWYVVPGSSYVYTDDGLAYAVPQAQLPPAAPPVGVSAAQPYQVVPTGWTPNPVTQPTQVGTPPPTWTQFKTGRSPLPYALGALGVLAVAGGTGVYVYSRRNNGHDIVPA